MLILDSFGIMAHHFLEQVVQFLLVFLKIALLNIQPMDYKLDPMLFIF